MLGKFDLLGGDVLAQKCDIGREFNRKGYCF